MTSDRKNVVVGLDGSRGATAALAFALDEARSLDVGVDAVCAYHPRLIFGSTGAYANDVSADADGPRAAAEHVAQDASTLAARIAPGVPVRTDTPHDSPADALLSRSHGAAMLVVGSRQLGGFGSFVLGSVSSTVAGRAHCPVVVVRREAGPPAPDAAVVVGVDETSASQDVLAFGFDYASRHRLPLRAVMCWLPDPPLLAVREGSAAGAGRGEQGSAVARMHLSEALAGWREKYPDVDVREVAIADFVPDGLLRHAAAQRLLVVGAHARRARLGMLLGSVAQAVLHHAPCAVAVVPVGDPTFDSYENPEKAGQQ